MRQAAGLANKDVNGVPASQPSRKQNFACRCRICYLPWSGASAAAAPSKTEQCAESHHPHLAVQEDELIIELVEQHGPKRWSLIAQELPGRIGKQCRERCASPVILVDSNVVLRCLSSRRPPCKAAQLQT